MGDFISVKGTRGAHFIKKNWVSLKWVKKQRCESGIQGVIIPNKGIQTGNNTTSEHITEFKNLINALSLVIMTTYLLLSDFDGSGIDTRARDTLLTHEQLVLLLVPSEHLPPNDTLYINTCGGGVSPCVVRIMYPYEKKKRWRKKIGLKGFYRQFR